MAKRSSRNFQSSSSYRKVQTNFAFRKIFYRKQSLGAQRQDKTRNTGVNKRNDENVELTKASTVVIQLLSFKGSNDSCKNRELKISLNSLYIPTRTETFCSFLSVSTFTDNSFRVQSTTLKMYTSQWWIQGRDPPNLQTKLRLWMTASLPYLDPPLHLHTNSIKNYVYCL